MGLWASKIARESGCVMCMLCTLQGSEGSDYSHMSAGVKRSAAVATGSAQGLTGDWRMDTVIQGAKWQGGNLSYSLWDNFFDVWGGELSSLGGFYKWDAEKKAAVREAFDSFEAITNLKFTYQETNGAKSTTSDIEIMGTGFVQQFTIGSVGLGVFPDKSFGDQWLGLLGVTRAQYPNVEGSVYLDNFHSVFEHDQPGGRGFWVLLHELGHALGMKHTHDDGGAGRPSLESLGLTQFDNNLYSMMSYHNVPGGTDARGNIATPMPNDILALQQLYGTNWNYNNGNSTYAVADNGIVKTIWDGGGTDVIDASSITSHSKIDLREGQYSKFGSTDGAIAFKVTIENAIGSRANDSIIGNEAANTLYGHGGSDTIYGGKGADTLVGGAALADTNDGGDVIYGDRDGDVIYGNSGNDTLYGASASSEEGDGADTIYAGFGADVIYGQAGNDSLYGGGGVAAPNDLADSLYGGGGNDQLFGNGGDDFLQGGAGNDSLHGGAGDDTYSITAQGGADVVLHFEGAGVAGGDVLQFASDLGFGSVSDIVDAFSFAGGNASLSYGGGSLRVVGISALGVDDIVIA